ncbi:hypothetical protein ScPMuIL_013928 [Solemya velum]
MQKPQKDSSASTEGDASIKTLRTVGDGCGTEVLTVRPSIGSANNNNSGAHQDDNVKKTVGATTDNDVEEAEDNLSGEKPVLENPEVGIVKSDEVVPDEQGVPVSVEDVDVDERGGHGVSTDRNDNHVKEELDEELDEEVPDLGDTRDLSKEGRNELFQRGVQFDQNGKKRSALACYLGCINGIKADTGFTLLPQCLRNIADIYYEQEDYPRAVHFAQAEKLYYENALIDTADLHSRLEKMKRGEEEGDIDTSVESEPLSKESLRAEEYEGLARLCLDKQQQQLALEYAGKAAKIRQEIYGDNHPITKQSLNFFTSLYAEVGKQQYSDSMRRFSSPTSSNGEINHAHGNADKISAENSSMAEPPPEPVSILRKRRETDPAVSVSDKEKRVRFHDSHGHIQHQTSEKEDQVARHILMLLFVICILVLLFLLFFIMCRLNTSMQICQQFNSEMRYVFMRMKYWYYQTYGNSQNHKYV